MKIVKTIDEMRKLINTWKIKGLSVGFVPTMGYIHEGHQSLIKNAGENDKIVVSIFRNPLIYSKNNFYMDCPSDLEKDCQICEETGADIIFLPDDKEMYPDDFCTYVEVSGLSGELCGKNRPFYFRDVCTAMIKLLNIVKPDKAYLGQKDAQQLAIIKKMVQDLSMDTQIISCPIIREADGLAKSYCNSLLNHEERRAALILSKTIRLAEGLIQSGEKEASVILKAMIDNINSEPLARIDYVNIVDAKTMSEVETIDNAVLVTMAVYIGKIRLTDNFVH